MGGFVLDKFFWLDGFGRSYFQMGNEVFGKCNQNLLVIIFGIQRGNVFYKGFNFLSGNRLFVERLLELNLRIVKKKSSFFTFIWCFVFFYVGGSDLFVYSNFLGYILGSFIFKKFLGDQLISQIRQFQFLGVIGCVGRSYLQVVRNFIFFNFYGIFRCLKIGEFFVYILILVRFKYFIFENVILIGKVISVKRWYRLILFFMFIIFKDGFLGLKLCSLKCVYQYYLGIC